jgi:hypothetical protein
MRRWVRAGRLRPPRFWRGGLGRSGPRRATPAAAKSASSLLETVPEAAPVSAGTAAEGREKTEEEEEPLLLRLPPLAAAAAALAAAARPAAAAAAAAAAL